MIKYTLLYYFGDFIINRVKTDSPTEEQEKLLKKARSLPGVEDVMQVYSYWIEKNRAFDSYRKAKNPPVHFTSSSVST